MLDSTSWSALLLSFKLGFVTVGLLLIIATPIAFWIATSKFRYKFIIEAIIALPLVLPPTVLGFYLLVFLNPDTYLGKIIQAVTGESILFSFSGLVIGSILYSLPFVVQPIINAFLSIDKNIIETAKTLKSGTLDRFFTVVLPLSKSGFYTGGIIGFAHTLGEFGVVLMLGGNIPGETKVVSIAIYDHVETLNYAQAHSLSAILLITSMIFLALVFKLNTPKQKTTLL